ncbi:MAG TPA: sigma-54 dependent transcriptional regulator [Polyangiaceae bacterium]|nr:sigma-54 dependent transcriptional regulator [Polyangiaceae bacterium]
MFNLLVVDDDEAMCGMIAAALRPEGYRVDTVLAPEAALARLAEREFDCVVTDLRMGVASGIELCAEISRLRPGVPVIVMTAFGSIRSAIEATRAGAFEFLVKPFELEALRHVVGRALEHRSLQKRVQQLEQTVQALESPNTMIGTSEPMKLLQQLIGRAASCDAGVLVLGESGTGKELVARSIHERSARRTGPFIAVNCAALPESLVESELFGYAKGAFTDARQDKAGLFVQAHGGTLFFDEIGELPLSLQPKLLRVLQDRTIRPLGASAEIQFDTRIIASTNRDLELEVAAGRFRQDLYYRVQVLQLDLPPLRVRGNDILLLARKFIESACQRQRRATLPLVGVAAQKLLAYDWPGNVRELQNCIERAVALSGGAELTLEDLPARVVNSSPEPVNEVGSDEFVSLDEVERRYILKVLRAVMGNKSLAAKILGLNRKTLYRKLGQYDVDVDVDPSE